MTQYPVPSDPVFRVSKGMRIAGGVILVPLVGFCILGPLWLLRLAGPDNWAFPATVLALGVGVAALMVYLGIAALRTFLEFTETGIRYTKGWPQPDDLAYDDIEGFRVTTNRNASYVTLFPRGKARKPVRISRSLERREELSKLFDERFRNLDAEDLKADMAEVLADRNLGSTEGERRAALERARTQAKVLNGITFAAMFWALLYPRPYLAAFLVLAALPLIAVLLVFYSRGALALDGKNTSARPNVATALITPSVILALRAFTDWHILGWSGFWVPFACIAPLLVAFLWLGSAGVPHRRTATMAGLSFICLLQGYGLVVFANCAFDHSPATSYRCKVVSRRSSSGRHTTYYVRVSPWIDGPISEEVSVAYAYYDRHPAGTPAQVDVRGGFLSMPWFAMR